MVSPLSVRNEWTPHKPANLPQQDSRRAPSHAMYTREDGCDHGQLDQCSSRPFGLRGQQGFFSTVFKCPSPGPPKPAGVRARVPIGLTVVGPPWAMHGEAQVPVSADTIRKVGVSRSARAGLWSRAFENKPTVPL